PRPPLGGAPTAHAGARAARPPQRRLSRPQVGRRRIRCSLPAALPGPCGKPAGTRDAAPGNVGRCPPGRGSRPRRPLCEVALVSLPPHAHVHLVAWGDEPWDLEESLFSLVTQEGVGLTVSVGVPTVLEPFVRDACARLGRLGAPVELACGTPPTWAPDA